VVGHMPLGAGCGLGPAVGTAAGRRFMARAWRVAMSAQHGAWHTRWRQLADERARCGEREADRWDPAADFNLN
jgi:hypothetical protein